MMISINEEPKKKRVPKIEAILGLEKNDYIRTQYPKVEIPKQNRK